MADNPVSGANDDVVTAAPPQPPPTMPPPPAAGQTGLRGTQFGQPVVVIPPRDPITFQRSWIVAATVAAIAADAAFRRPPWNNLAGSLLVFALVGGLAASGKITTRASRIALGLAAVFGLLLMVRTDPRLVAFNGMAVLALTFVATLRPHNMFDYRPLQSLRDLVESVNQGALLLNEVPREIQARKHVRSLSGAEPSRSAALLRGLLIAGPIVLVLGLLLGSADAVFASFFTSPVSAGSIFSHLTLAVMGAAMMAFLIRVAHAGSAGEAQISAPGLGKIETFVLLGSINLLFAAFAIAQLVATTDAGAATLAEQGLSYKDYARQGFFQLLWVAGITLVVLLSVRAMTITWSRQAKSFQGLGLVSVALTLVIVAVAFIRLQLYIGDDGLTPLRFYSAVFSLWVGLAFVLVALRLLNIRADQAWTMPALFGSGLAVLFVLNLINPEAVIANNNLDRDDRSMLWHMEKLTGDGQAVLADGLNRLSPELRDEVETKLCRIGTAPGNRTREGFEVEFGDDAGDADAVLRAPRVDARDGGWLSWNLGQRSAESELDQLCGELSS